MIIPPLNVREKNITDFKIRFNRHEIMHGIAVDYGIEENFWKAVSLLYFMAELIRFKENKLSTPPHIIYAYI